MDDDSFAFAIERHKKPYFGSSASKRSLVVVESTWPVKLRLGRSGGMEARRGLFVDDEDDDDAMVKRIKRFVSFSTERLLGVAQRDDSSGGANCQQQHCTGKIDCERSSNGR